MNSDSISSEPIVIERLVKQSIANCYKGHIASEAGVNKPGNLALRGLVARQIVQL